MVNLQVSDTIQPAVDLQQLERAANATVNEASPSITAELTILLTDDNKLHELNKEFLEIDAPTDVLSFPADFVDPDSETPYLGDVIISYPRAQEQAEAGGHRVESELELLVIHGVLHLLGYDHTGEEDKAEMWAVQARVLAQLGSPLSPP
ncbi:MAG: rRNA maturation RNase YbeY [Chloroflexota bacterium]|nr:MAG: rRNA maturation RNase YbeY [Chloroflexota bacterium]